MSPVFVSQKSEMLSRWPLDIIYIMTISDTMDFCNSGGNCFQSRGWNVFSSRICNDVEEVDWRFISKIIPLAIVSLFLDSIMLLSRLLYLLPKNIRCGIWKFSRSINNSFFLTHACVHVNSCGFCQIASWTNVTSITSNNAVDMTTPCRTDGTSSGQTQERALALIILLDPVNSGHRPFFSYLNIGCFHVLCL